MSKHGAEAKRCTTSVEQPTGAANHRYSKKPQDDDDSAFADADVRNTTEERVASSHSNYEVNDAEMADGDGDFLSPKENLLPALKMEDLSLKLNKPTSSSKKANTPLRSVKILNKNVAEQIMTRQSNSRVFERLSHI